MTKKKSLVLHAILQKKPYFKSKKDALNDARQHFENQKIKGFTRETDSSYRVRVVPKTKFIKTEYVSKKISPNTTLVFGKLKGGAVVASDVSQFVEESYKKPKEASKQIGEYKLDKDLSTRKAKVYHDPKTNKTIVANRGTTGTLSDWTNNLRYGTDLATGNIFNLYNKSDRMKQAEKVQKEAIKKYGKVDTNIGHSQSGIITRELNKQGLTNEVININPASFFEKPKKNEKTYRSKYDPVSIFSRGAKTLKGPINPLKAHSSSFLKKSKKLLGGNINEEINTYFNTYKSIVESGEKPAQITRQKNKLIDSVYKKFRPTDIDDFLRLVNKYKKEYSIIEKPKTPKTPKAKKEASEAKKEAKRIAKEEKEALKFPQGYDDIDKKRFLTAEKYIKKLLKEGKFEELKEDEEYNIKFISSEYAENPKYKRMSENLIHILLDDGLAKPEKPIKTPKVKEVISKKRQVMSKKTDNKEELQKLINEISNTKIKEKLSNINKEEVDKLLNKIDKIQKNKKADNFRKKQLLKKALKAIKEDRKPKEDKPFNLDEFEEVNGYELMLYKKNYYLRDLETSEIYNIKNNKPFEKVGLYNIQKKRIILDKKPSKLVIPQVKKPEIPVIPQVKTKAEKNKIADDFRKKQLLKKSFKSLKPKYQIIETKKEINKIVNEIENTKNKKLDKKINIKEANELIKDIENKLNLPKPIETKEPIDKLINNLESRLQQIHKIGETYKEPLKYGSDAEFTLFGYLYLIDKYDLPNILFGLIQNEDKFKITSYSINLSPSFFFGMQNPFNKKKELDTDYIISNLSKDKNFIKNLFTEIKLFIDSGEELIFIPLHFTTGADGAHANMLIFRVNEGIIERFEPHGRVFSEPQIDQGINNVLKNLFEVESEKYLGDDTPIYKIIEPTNITGFQGYESKVKKHIFDGGGYCQLWSLFFMELVALNRDIPSFKLIDNSVEIAEASPQYFLNIIRGYVSIIYKEMNDFLKTIKKDYHINFEEKSLSKQTTNMDLINYLSKLKEDFKLKPKKERKQKLGVSKDFLDEIKDMEQDEIDEYIDTLEDILETNKHIGYQGKELTKVERNTFLKELNYLKNK